jgi:hypothetical protein
MGVGTVLWACVTLAVPAGAPETTYFNQRGFKIPVRLSNERRAEIQKLILYVSKDQGKSWECQERADPNTNAFIYMAQADGTFWFTIATVNARGEETPRDVLTSPPGQKVVVDTVKPVLRLQAERRGEEVALSWNIEEDNPDLTSLQGEYQTPEGRSFPIAVVPDRQGQTTFRPGTAGDVTVRMKLKDRAGNEGEGVATVTPGGSASGGGLLTGGNPQGVAEPAGKVTPAGGDGVRRADSLTRNAKPSPESQALDNSLFPAPVNAGATLPGPAPSAGDPRKPAAAAGAVVSPARPPAPHDLGPGLGNLAPAPPLGSGDKVAGPGPSGPLAGATRGALPDLQYTNKRQVKLEFDVSRVGPSGLGGVEVYMTTDEGLTWAAAPVEGNATLPANADTRSAGPMHGSVAVNLPQEGMRYGFCVVVKSRAGLGKPPPQKGEPPHVRLELDQTPPRAALYRPQPDPNRPNTLILSWMAVDRNLTANPVSLEWAERREGPWLPVNTEPLPNNLPAASGPTGEQAMGPTGTFAWQLPERMPSRVFLRLTVRDTAGNVSVAQTPEPVLIDLTVPEVGNVSVTVGVR